MADWSLPTTTSNYATQVLQSIDDRLKDVATGFNNTVTSNLPTNAIGWDTNNLCFRQWNGSAWADIQVSIIGGGTGASTATGARTNLGLGSMATQNSSSVSITGGSVAASTLNGLVPTANLGTGSASSATVLFGNQTWGSIASFFPGIILIYGSTTAPSGWLNCDGSAVSRTTYASLFAIIGTSYGAGDGVSTFNLPNLQQRFPLGKATSGTGSVLG